MNLVPPPQTDQYPGAGYVSKDYIKNGIVTLNNPSSSLNVRNKPNGDIIGSLKHGTSVKITDQVEIGMKLNLRLAEHGKMPKGTM